MFKCLDVKMLICMNMSETRGRKPPERPRQEKREKVDRFDFGSAQVKAPKHPQQDYCAIALPLDSGPVVALVADGVSGVKHGAEASRLAGESFVNEIQRQMGCGEKLDVERAIRIANAYLLAEAGRKNGDLRNRTLPGVKLSDTAIHRETGMYTTFTGIVIDGDRILSAHLGDSRLYLFSQGLITQMTGDETVAERLRASGVDERKITHEYEHLLANSLGDKNAEPAMDEYKAVLGDIWLLVSDGVTGVLSDRELEEVLSQPKDAQSLANDIIEAVKAKGVVDDTTAVVVKVK